MIRIETIRRIDCKQGKGRNRVNPISIAFDTSIEDALREIVEASKVSEEIAPGYMPITEIRFFDKEAFNADPFGATPLKVLRGKELAAAINVPGQTA